MPAEGRENPLLKKGNSDAFFREKYLTKNMNLANIEGFLRNAGYRILGLGEELLFSHASLLDTIRQTHQDWLERILRIIYNSGGFLPAVPW